MGVFLMPIQEAVMKATIVQLFCGLCCLFVHHAPAQKAPEASEVAVVHVVTVWPEVSA